MHFENEELDSIEADKEFEIKLRAMLAQDESRNISENIQCGFQRKFGKGDIFTEYKNFIGYPIGFIASWRKENIALEHMFDII